MPGKIYGNVYGERSMDYEPLGNAVRQTFIRQTFFDFRSIRIENRRMRCRVVDSIRGCLVKEPYKTPMEIVIAFEEAKKRIEGSASL
jgi:hypothetical protein